MYRLIIFLAIFLIEKKNVEEGGQNDINRVDKPHSTIDYYK